MVPFYCVLGVCTEKVELHFLRLWRPCSFIPIHSLTGAVGHPFASWQGGSSSRPGDASTHTNKTGSPVSYVCLATLVTLMWSLLATIGPLCSRPCDNLSHSAALAIPSRVHSNKQSHWSSGSTVCFLPRRVAVRILGMHPHIPWNRVLLLAMSCYMPKEKRNI